MDRLFDGAAPETCEYTVASGVGWCPCVGARASASGNPSALSPGTTLRTWLTSDVSITGHGAIFRNLLAVLGHQPYPLATGEMIPVVVKATLRNVNGRAKVNGTNGEC